MLNKTLLIALLSAPVGALAQSSLTTFGTPGLIDMPSAESAPDAELSTTVSYFGGTTRTTLTFQITPRLSGSFRYTGIQNWNLVTGGGTFDRSFDLRYRLVDEGKYRPSIAVGLQDFIGTGIYSGEYVVASKRIIPTVTVTGGIGWGRFGSFNGFNNPLGGLSDSFNARPTARQGKLGGVVESAKWFRGDAAFFGGVAWQATPKLTLKAEYSSDGYTREVSRTGFTRKSPYNFGLDYKVNSSFNLYANYLYGSEFGAGVSIKLNPKEPAVNGGAEKAPQPVRVRLPQNVNELGWTNLPNVQKNLRKATSDLLVKDGMVLEAMSVSPKSVTLRLRNERYLASAEAIGRTARILTRV
ncbi:YjbH domain-containing protein, partial [Planktotalea frisia]|uniref:YjbH domain-containing protein n=1 Tax=Planktotalea frisia TaxID=696762 RepID=UPI0023575633